MNFKEEEFQQVLKDAEELTHDELRAVVGGNEPVQCAGCCSIQNGGSNR